MTSVQHRLLSIVLFVAAISSGCSTATTYLQTSRTAGFVGARPGKMYVVNIEGTDAGSFRDQLYQALSDDGHFTTERYGVAPLQNQAQNPDSATNIPSIILAGIHSTHESTRYFKEGTGDDEKKYKETTETHGFQYTIQDAVTGEELDANVVRQDNVAKEEDRDASFLDAVVGDLLKGMVEDLVGVESAHRKGLIRSFVATLRLHPEKRSIGLFQDKDIPELKEGVEFARKGNWEAAIVKFQAGAESHPKSEVLHKAYFNLGVAFEYNHEFEKARTSLRLADELGPYEGYAAEIDYCQWFARQYRWQQRYAGFSSEVPNRVE